MRFRKSEENQRNPTQVHAKHKPEITWFNE